MTDDPFANEGMPPGAESLLTYTLIVKAASDADAMDAFGANAPATTRRLNVRAVPSQPERVLEVEFAADDDVPLSRRPVELGLNEWLLRDIDHCRDGVGFPMGSLLWWRRSAPDEG